MDEVLLAINKVRYYVWRAVDQAGHLLNILVQCRRDKKAKRFCRKLLKGLIYVPRVIITDTINSCGVAQREMLPDMKYFHCRYFNNHAENSH